MMIANDEEPTVTLATGETVNAHVLDAVRGLQLSGHGVRIDLDADPDLDEPRVVITPAVRQIMLQLLDSNSGDVAKILDAGPPDYVELLVHLAEGLSAS